eukprot:g13177.t3
MGDKAELGRLRRIYAFAGGMALHSNEAREQREAMEFYVAFAFQKEQAEDLPTCQELRGSRGSCAASLCSNSSDCSGEARCSELATRPHSSQKSLAKAKKEMSESGLLHLVASVQDVLSKPHEGDRIRDLKALAAELKHTQNSTSPMEGPLRWVANMAAALLLTQGMALQPANAGDVVNYSDFIDSVNKGDVEMVRVQPDMLSAQYVTKEGARREVNLIPNGQIEDQLFNQLADKKVDVVMSTGEAGSPFDFLARFAGPLAWLVAGLLLLFGGVGGPAGPGGPGGNPFELGKSKARIIKDGDTKVKFGDVAGCDGAKTELVEVVDFLKNASRLDRRHVAGPGTQNWAPRSPRDGAVKRVDMYDMGRTAVASVTIAGREQQLICDLPGASTGVIDKLVAKNVAIDVHQPDTWMNADDIEINVFSYFSCTFNRFP